MTQKKRFKYLVSDFFLKLFIVTLIPDKMAAINIPLFELGKSNHDLYNICQLVLKAKDIKSITSEVVTAGGACLVELFAFSPTLALKYTTQLKTAIGTNPTTRQTSFQFNTKNGRYDPHEYIPRFYADALNSYITVCGTRNIDLTKKYGLPENETHRQLINSAADLLTTIAKLCNILMPLCKRKKVDCFHIQTALKIIYLADNPSLERLLIKTINSTAKLLVNDGTLANTIKTDAMISKTVATFNSVLTGGITITNEAAIYLSMFILSLNPGIEEPDKLVTLSTKRTVNKKKKTPDATPVAKPDGPSTAAPDFVSSDTAPDSTKTENTNNHASDTPVVAEPKLIQKLAFKLKF
jgi:hypothetical protein